MIEIPDIELIRRCLIAHNECCDVLMRHDEFESALQALEQRIVDLRAEIGRKEISQHILWSSQGEQ